MKSVEELLFRLRFSQYRWDDADNSEIEKLRPYVRSNHRVREILMAVVLEADYLSIPSRNCLEILLDELPDSPQAKYLLRMHAYEYRGEDSMGTLSARKVMCRKGLTEERLRREIEQTAFENYSQGIRMPNGEYVGKDLRGDFVIKKFWEWAAESARYVPCILGDMTIGYSSVDSVVQIVQKHPNFPLSEYDFGIHTHEFECRFAAGAERPGVVALIKAMREDGMPLRSIYEIQKHAPVKSWSEDDFAFIKNIADDPNDPFREYTEFLIIATAHTSPLAMEWVRNRIKANPGDQSFHRKIAYKIQDPEIARESLTLLADGHNEFVTVAHSICSFANIGKKLPEAWAVPVLVRGYNEVPPDRKHDVLVCLQAAYPNHAETRRLIEQAKPREPATPPNEFQALVELAGNSTGYEASKALRKLAEQFLDRPGVEALLFKKAAEEKEMYTRANALIEVAFRFPEAPATIELLTRPSANPWDSWLQETLLNHLSAEYETFEQLRARMSSGEEWRRKIAVAGIALWYADLPGAFDLLSPSIETLVQRWPDEDRTFALLRTALIRGIKRDLDFSIPKAIDAARLLSRAFSHHPETGNLLRQYMDHRPAIFAEYLGLNIGNDAEMDWGTAVLEGLFNDQEHTDLAEAGPKLLIRYFGPRKRLLEKFQQLQSSSKCQALTRAIGKLFQERFPERVRS